MSNQKRKTSGFTIIEVMVVVMILGILAALIVPNLVGKDDQARLAVAKSDLRAISSALDLFKMDNYSYPTTDQGLEALVRDPGNAPNWAAGGYLKSKPKDPWKRDYIYISPGSNGPYDLICLGADGQEGGEGVNADISLVDI